MPSPTRPRVLVTGFGAFPGAPRNPTIALTHQLAASRRLARHRIAVTGAILPVVFAHDRARLDALVAQATPDIVVHLGLAARRKVLTIETRASNRSHPLRADASGRTAPPLALPGGPAFRITPWPVARLRAAMCRAGAPTRRSIDAGSYVCNQTLYHSLCDTRRFAGFIHVPLPGRAEGGARPTLAAMLRALEAAVLLLVVAHRRHRSLAGAGAQVLA